MLRPQVKAVNVKNTVHSAHGNTTVAGFPGSHTFAICMHTVQKCAERSPGARIQCWPRPGPFILASHLPRFCHSFRAYFANYRAIKSAWFCARQLHESFARRAIRIYSLASSFSRAPAGTYLNALGAAPRIKLICPHHIRRRLPFFNSPPTPAAESTATNGPRY